jgi:hypothetical protein
MRISQIALLILASSVLFSCQPNQEELNTIKRAEVIAVHDEVMPKMGQLKKLEKEAEKKIEMLEMGETVDSLQIQELKALAFDLNQAYDAMFVWMRQYKPNDIEMSPEEINVKLKDVTVDVNIKREKTPEGINVYLEEQLVKVNEVNAGIKAVLEKSEKVLKD